MSCYSGVRKLDRSALLWCTALQGFLCHVSSHHPYCSMHWPLVPYCFFNKIQQPLPSLQQQPGCPFTIHPQRSLGSEACLSCSMQGQSCGRLSCGRAAAHSLASHSCLCYLLRVVRDRKCSAGHVRPICRVPYRYILKECVETADYAYKQKDFLLGSSIYLQNPCDFWGLFVFFLPCLFARQNL